jgi:hypothetical protein
MTVDELRPAPNDYLQRWPVWKRVNSSKADVQIRRFCRARVLLCCRILTGPLLVEFSRSESYRANYVSGLQENLKGQDAASEEMRAEFKVLVEQCRTALRDRADEND